MNIELIANQTCKVYVKLQTDEEFDVYGGTTKQQFPVSKTENGEHLVLIPAPDLSSCGGTAFDIFARRKSTNQEWLIMSGRINVRSRRSRVDGTVLSPLEYRLDVPVTDDIDDLEVPPVYVGIPGARGYSAYDIAVQHGYEGTEEEFIQMLVAVTDAPQRAYDAQILAETSAVNALKYAQEAKAILDEIKGVTS